MLKKILLLSTLLVSMHIQDASAIPMSSGYVEKEPQTHGMFKIYLDKRNKIAITRSKKLNSQISHEQAIELLRGYNKQYLQLQTSKEKAQLAYRLLLKVAAKADFKVEVRSTPVYKQTLRLRIYSTDDMGGSTSRLIPEKDMNSVVPIILKLIKTNPKPTIATGTILCQSFSVGLKMKTDIQAGKAG